MYISATLPEILQHIQGLYDFQKKKADDTIPKVMKLEPIPSGYTFYGSSLKVGKSYYNSSGRAPETLAEHEQAVESYLKTLDEAEVKVKELIEKNAPAIENNKLIREKVSLIMRELGVPGTYQERDWKSKARMPKYNTFTAGYVGDLGRNVPVSDSGGIALSAIAKARTDAKAWVETKRKELAAKEAAAAKLKEEDRKQKVLVHMRVKYGCDPEDSAGDILDKILEKNKYLHLAHYLLQTRNDWSEGFGSAEYGINHFKVETEEDQQIWDSLNEILEDEDMDRDGRVFRDTEYGYDYVFGLVEDESLMADYNTISGYINY